MSEQDDWARFVAMCEKEGWTLNRAPLYFVYSAGRGHAAFYYPESGHMQIGGKDSNVGTWREWLAAGSSPVPF